MLKPPTSPGHDEATSQHPAQRTEHARVRNFEAGTALENLRAEMVNVEALVRATEAAADALRAPVTERQCLVFGRIQSLATKTSEQAGASLRVANAQVAALTAHLASDSDGDRPSDTCSVSAQPRSPRRPRPRGRLVQVDGLAAARR